jgi:hypothetical protein
MSHKMFGQAIMLLLISGLTYILWQQLARGVTYQRSHGYEQRRVPISRKTEPLRFWGTAALLIALIVFFGGALINSLISN